MYASTHGGDPALLLYSPLILAVVVAFRIAAHYVPRLRPLVVAVASRFEVFLYVVFPVGCISVIVVGLRNLR
jgi:hypothetical protein